MSETQTSEQIRSAARRRALSRLAKLEPTLFRALYREELEKAQADARVSNPHRT